MKLILHIGQSKTGTSSIQRILQENRKKLAGQGFLYPDCYSNGMPLSTPEHNSLAEQLAGFSRYPRLSADEYFTQIEKQQANGSYHSVILSGESFFGAPQVWKLDNPDAFFSAHEAKLQALKKYTQGYDVQVICYLRHPLSWFESCIAHLIRYEGLMGRRLYTNDDAMLDLLMPHMDYKRILGLWDEIISTEKMSVVPYERKRLADGDIVQDFLSHAGIDATGLDLGAKVKDENRSLDRRLLDVKKDLNKRPKSKTEERAIISCMDAVNATLDEFQKFSISKELAEEVLYQTKHVTDWLDQNYSDDREHFFSATPAAKDLPPPTQEEVDAVRRLFEARYNSMPARLERHQIAIKSFLRNRLSIPYALLKNTYYFFQNKKASLWTK